MPEPIEDKKVIAGDNQTQKTEEKKPTEEKTIGELLDDKKPKSKESDEDDEDEKQKLVPEAAFLSEKSKRKQLEKDIKALKQKIESGESDDDDIQDDVDSIAEEFDVDKKFLKKLVKVIQSKADEKAEARVASRLKPLEEDKKQERIDKAFNKAFNKAMETMEDFKDIVDPEVIKTLSLDPKNANKTFSQIIEDTYGKSLGGKRTIEKTTPRGGKEPEPIDYARAQRDGKYFDEIMSNPESKKEYNKNLEKRLAQNL